MDKAIGTGPAVSGGSTPQRVASAVERRRKAARAGSEARAGRRAGAAAAARAVRSAWRGSPAWAGRPLEIPINASPSSGRRNPLVSHRIPVPLAKCRALPKRKIRRFAPKIYRSATSRNRAKCGPTLARGGWQALPCRSGSVREPAHQTRFPSQIRRPHLRAAATAARRELPISSQPDSRRPIHALRPAGPAANGGRQEPSAGRPRCDAVRFPRVNFCITLGQIAWG